jgi:YHS domain-containing protein
VPSRAGGKAANAVCGMTVDQAAAAAHTGYDGEA